MNVKENHKLRIWIWLFFVLFSFSSFPLKANDAEDALLRIEQEKIKEEAAKVAGQSDSQKRSSKTKERWGKYAQLLGIGLSAWGTWNVVQGASTTPQNTGQIERGLFYMAGGLAAFLVGNDMKNKAHEGRRKENELTSTTQDRYPRVPHSNYNPAPTGTRSSIGSSDLHTGTLSKIMDNFEDVTGVDREDLANALLNGDEEDAKNALSEILANSSGLGAEQIQAGIDAASASLGTSSGALEELAKEAGLGALIAEEDEAMVAGGGAPFGNLGGDSGGSDLSFLGRKPASGEAVRPGRFKFSSFSEKVRKQLQKEGYGNRSLFEIVSNKYRSLTPHMLGEGKKTKSLSLRTR